MMTTVTINNTPVEIYANLPDTTRRPFPSFSFTNLDSCHMSLRSKGAIFSGCDSCGLSIYQTGSYCVDNFKNWLQTSNFKQTNPEFFI